MSGKAVRLDDQRRSGDRRCDRSAANEPTAVTGCSTGGVEDLRYRPGVKTPMRRCFQLARETTVDRSSNREVRNDAACGGRHWHWSEAPGSVARRSARARWVSRRPSPSPT